MGTPRNNSSVRSFSRGLTVLRLLAVHGEMTATEIAAHLGVHQSSASRLLRSLEDEGYVYKPHFHRFALGVDVLLFAGLAMEHFREVREGARACAELHRSLRAGAASVMLLDNRLVYLARIHEGAASPLTLVDDSSFPVHRSTPGLLLAYLGGKRLFRDVMQASAQRVGEEPEECDTGELWRTAGEALGDDGVLYLQRFGENACSAALAYDTPRGTAALTVYSHQREIPRHDAARALHAQLQMVQS